ncbi:hypothetical protein HPP92_014619 [Vanilla planifolia]|uniref:Late embryogenesis abundant protein LEA-2 subgroup domain-containing protein n=1 Tax=Vanilla planifolia TaxID=51239 RepID=A0A835QUT8_VANPL|nr:hypothetical protein HPP92_014619 [Vanilla planifolia]
MVKVLKRATQPEGQSSVTFSTDVSDIHRLSRHCAAKHRLYISKFNKKLLSAASTLIFTILLLSLLIWIILRPSKPEFSLRDAAIYDLSLSSYPLARLLNSTIQATIVSKNPNARVGVYYDRLRACAVYKGQQITADASLPPFYQGHGDINLLPLPSPAPTSRFHRRLDTRSAVTRPPGSFSFISGLMDSSVGKWGVGCQDGSGLMWTALPPWFSLPAASARNRQCRWGRRVVRSAPPMFDGDHNGNE